MTTPHAQEQRPAESPPIYFGRGLRIDLPFLPKPPEGLCYFQYPMFRGKKKISSFFCSGLWPSALNGCEGNRKTANLVRAAAVSFDVDFCDHPSAQNLIDDAVMSRVQKARAEHDERMKDKNSNVQFPESAAIRSAIKKVHFYPKSPDEMERWVLANHVYDDLFNELEQLVGGMPNYIIHTGHGLCIGYWLPETHGYTAKQSKGHIVYGHAGYRQLMQTAAPRWWIDPRCHDVGTRLSPVPGWRHREDPRKEIQLIAGHDQFVDLSPMWTTLGADPVDRTKKVKQKVGQSIAPHSLAGYRAEYVDSIPTDYRLEKGERGDCWLCEGSRLPLERYENNGMYVCHSCRCCILIRLPLEDFTL